MKYRYIEIDTGFGGGHVNIASHLDVLLLLTVRSRIHNPPYLTTPLLF